MFINWVGIDYMNKYKSNINVTLLSGEVQKSRNRLFFLSTAVIFYYTFKPTPTGYFSGLSITLNSNAEFYYLALIVLLFWTYFRYFALYVKENSSVVPSPFIAAKRFLKSMDIKPFNKFYVKKLGSFSIVLSAIYSLFTLIFYLALFALLILKNILLPASSWKSNLEQSIILKISELESSIDEIKASSPYSEFNEASSHSGVNRTSDLEALIEELLKAKSELDVAREVDLNRNNSHTLLYVMEVLAPIIVFYVAVYLIFYDKYY